MRKPFFRAALVATLLGVVPLAMAGPDNTAFRSYRFQVNGFSEAFPIAGSGYANSEDDPFTGVGVGLVSLYWIDGVESFAVACSGPSMANAVSVNQGSGRATVFAVLDPNSLDCYTFNYFGPPLTVNLTGAATGDHTSQTGSGTQTSSGTSYKYNFQEDFFTEAFVGDAIPGLADYQGIAGRTMRSDRQQIR